MGRDYKKLEVWHKGMDIAQKIHVLSKCFPKHEIYGLVSQMRRSALSIPSNIAEGYARGYDNELKRYLNIALGSLAELETQVILSQRFLYISELDENTILEKLDHVKRMLLNLIKKL